MRLSLFLSSLVIPVFAGPENTVILINADSPASQLIANEYADARSIPPTHLIRLSDVPSFDRIGVEEFRERILQPALAEAQKRGLGAQTDYLLYSADFPTAIDVSADMAGREFPKVVTQPASLTGLTFFYPLTVAKNPAYLGFNTNFYFRQRILANAAGPMLPEDAQRYQQAIVALKNVPPDAPDLSPVKAVKETLANLRARHSRHAELLYNLACAHARLGETSDAIAALRAAVDAGWWEMRQAQQDPYMQSVREMPEFQELLQLALRVPYSLMPTSGFRAAAGWNPMGQPVAVDKGMHYVLSTMLACTSGRGLGMQEAVLNLRRSASADGTRPAGTVYFPENDDVRSTTREWAYPRAVELLGTLGIAAKIEKGVLPQQRADVVGASIGASDFDWARSGSTILPGAIVEHLTSFGGMLSHDAGQTPLTALIRAGAAGASGTVTEPFAIQQKFPTAFVHWHYAQGCTLAEAYYQSVAAPYQLLIVGDALCAPWKKRITPAAGPLGDGLVLGGVVKMTPAANSPDGLRPGSFELYLNGRRIALARIGEPLEWDTRQVADGVHTLTLLVNAADPLGTRGTLRAVVVVKNHNTTLSLSSAPERHPWDRPLAARAAAPGAKRIRWFQGEDLLTTISGAEGEVMLEPARLGPGPVSLHVEAEWDDGRVHRSAPWKVRIVPPEPLPALVAPAKLRPGLRLGNGAELERLDAAALAKAGVPKDAGFAVEGWFTMPKTEWAQFQIRNPAAVRVWVDGQQLAWPAGKAWGFIPMHLSAGPHRVRIEGRNDGVTDVRFGYQGTALVAAPFFQNEGPP